MADETSQTIAQVESSIPDDGILPRPLATEIESRFEELIEQPSIALVRAFATAPSIISEWSVTSTDEAPEDAKNLVEDLVLPLRDIFMSQAVLGTWDYGWNCFEKLGAVDSQGRWYIKKLKALSHEKTKLKVDPEGSLIGAVNYDEYELPVEALLVNYINVKGTNWYGKGYLKRMAQIKDWWDQCNNSAIRYDKKVAGAHWVVSYPVGSSMYKGSRTENSQIAIAILNSLESSGSVIVPLETYAEAVNNTPGWNIEIKSAYPTSGVAFLDRLRYLDTQYARAAEVPERGVFESQYGTKAEAGEHIDWATTGAESRAKELIRQFNWYLVNPVLVANYGPEAENTVQVTVSDINKAKRERIIKVYGQMMQDPAIRAQEYPKLDTVAIYDQMGIPITPEARLMTALGTGTPGTDTGENPIPPTEPTP